MAAEAERGTALPAAPPRALLVVGMHRSATSALTELLAENGFYAGEQDELVPANFSNVHGHFEHNDVTLIDAEMLQALGARWFAPPRFENVEAAVDRLAAEFGPRIEQLVSSLGQRGVPVIKDPRAVLSLPVWAKVLPNAVFAVTIRNPLAVARSLSARDDSRISAGLALWEVYNAALLRWLPLQRSVFHDVDSCLRDGDTRKRTVRTLQRRLRAPRTPWVDSFDDGLLHAPPAQAQWRQLVTAQQADIYAVLTAKGGLRANTRVPLDAAYSTLHGYVPNREAWLINAQLAEQRAQLSEQPPVIAATDAEGNEPPRTAVVAHVFYPELWSGLNLQLGNLHFPFDLFVSVSDPAVAELVLADRPDADIRLGRNTGRDIGPFLDLIASGSLESYDAVLKLHTKKSPHRVDGDAWRISLWHGLLSDPASARRLAWHVAASTGAGCVLPAGNLLPFTADDPNWPLAEELLAHGPWPLQEATFPAGSMYWLSPPAVRAIATLPRWQHGAEVDDLDGTPSHVLERLVGIALRTHGLAIQTCEDVLAQERDAQLR